MSGPVFQVERGCPAAPGGCCCYGACKELIDVVRAEDYWRAVGALEEMRRRVDDFLAMPVRHFPAEEVELVLDQVGEEQS